MRKRTLITLALAAAAPLALAGCAEDYYGDGYNYNAGYGWQNYPYDVYYDNYYGPFYDGYWGSDGYFWYRLLQSDRTWRRGGRDHFNRDGGNHGGQGGGRGGGNNGGHNWQHYNGTVHQPPANARLPNFPGWGGNRGTNTNRNRDRR